MTISHAWRDVKWIRSLLTEMGFGYMVKQPTLSPAFDKWGAICINSGSFVEQGTDALVPNTVRTQTAETRRDPYSTWRRAIKRQRRCRRSGVQLQSQKCEISTVAQARGCN